MRRERCDSFQGIGVTYISQRLELGYLLGLLSVIWKEPYYYKVIFELIIFSMLDFLKKSNHGNMSKVIAKSIKYNPETEKLITLGAGCFWGTEHIYRKHLGDKIHDSKVGYANGDESSKDLLNRVSYKRVCKGDTNFCEVLQISYDPKKVSLKELIDFFFRIHDPTTVNAQGPDVGTQYRSAIFTHSPEDLKEVQKLKEEWQPKWNNKIVTEVGPIETFYEAEEYHQIYLDRNPNGYACPTHFVRNLK
ncbi:Peptide methionine sulfoxide reductase [Nakaseomyces glabratus]